MVIAAQKMIDKIMETFPRLMGLKLFAPREKGEPAKVIAAETEEIIDHRGRTGYIKKQATKGQ